MGTSNSMESYPTGCDIKILSYPLSAQTPMYGNNSAFEVIPDKQIESGDVCNTAVIKMHNHSGTHIDFPRHFCPQGKTSSNYSVRDLIYLLPCVIECHKNQGDMITLNDILGNEDKIRGSDILLFKTNFGRFRDQNVYRMHNPGIDPDLAQTIRNEYSNVRAVGVDCISVSSFQHREAGRQAHRAFLSIDVNNASIVLVEDLDLSGSLENMQSVMIVPLNISEIDAAPCTVLGFFKRKQND